MTARKFNYEEKQWWVIGKVYDFWGGKKETDRDTYF